MPINIKKLNISNNKLQNIYHPEYLVNLQILQIQENKLTYLPQLTDNIQLLDTSCNLISQINKLPESITQFDCSRNLLTSLFPAPAKLFKIYAYKNKITSIPEHIQTSNITELDISYNQIHTLENLPYKLEILDITDNLVANINRQHLPISLHNLDIKRNLISLPDILHIIHNIKFIQKFSHDHEHIIRQLNMSQNRGQNQGNFVQLGQHNPFELFMAQFHNQGQANSWSNHDQEQDKLNPDYIIPLETKRV